MQVLIFNEFGLKMPTHAPKIEVLVNYIPINGAQPDCDPQRAPPCVETRHTTYRSLTWCNRFCALTLLSKPQNPMVYNRPYTPLKVPFPIAASVPLSNTWFPALGPHDSASQTASRPSPQQKQHRNSFSCFCMAHYCDRLTDHTTRSVTTGRIYVLSTAMWPKKTNTCPNVQQLELSTYLR